MLIIRHKLLSQGQETGLALFEDTGTLVLSVLDIRNLLKTVLENPKRHMIDLVY